MFAAASVCFMLVLAYCAHRLRWSNSLLDLAIGAPALVASWAWVMLARQLDATTALGAFLLADAALLVLPFLGVVRLLGGFDEQPPELGELGGDEDGGGGISPPPFDPPLAPRQGRHPYPSASRRRARRQPLPRPLHRPLHRRPRTPARRATD